MLSYIAIMIDIINIVFGSIEKLTNGYLYCAVEQKIYANYFIFDTIVYYFYADYESL
jgi:hypothetical protein